MDVWLGKRVGFQSRSPTLPCQTASWWYWLRPFLSLLVFFFCARSCSRCFNLCLQFLVCPFKRQRFRGFCVAILEAGRHGQLSVCHLSDWSLLMLETNQGLGIAASLKYVDLFRMAGFWLACGLTKKPPSTRAFSPLPYYSAKGVSCAGATAVTRSYF